MSELNEGIRIKSWQEWRQGISNAKKRIGNFLSPPRETSNEPTVRSGERTPQTAGINQHIPSRDQSGARYDNSDNSNKNKPVVVNKNNNKPVVVNKNKPVVVNKNSSSSVQNQINKNDADKERLKNNPAKFFGTNQYGEGGSQIKGGPVVKKPVSSEIKKQDQQIKKVQPVKTDDYLGKSQGLLGKDAWLKKSSKSPAARSMTHGKPTFSNDERWAQQLKHRQWQKDNNRGAFRVQKVNTPKIQTQEYELDAYDLVLEHLIATQQADTIKEAHYVMMEMDADIIKAIVDEAKIDDVKYGTGKGWNQPDKKRIDIYHSRHSYLKKNPPNVRSDRNKRHSAQDVVFYGHDKVERDRKKKHHASRGVKKERGSKN